MVTIWPSFISCLMTSDASGSSCARFGHGDGLGHVDLDHLGPRPAARGWSPWSRSSRFHGGAAAFGAARHRCPAPVSPRVGMAFLGRPRRPADDGFSRLDFPLPAPPGPVRRTGQPVLPPASSLMAGLTQPAQAPGFVRAFGDQQHLLAAPTSSSRMARSASARARGDEPRQPSRGPRRRPPGGQRRPAGLGAGLRRATRPPRRRGRDWARCLRREVTCCGYSGLGSRRARLPGSASTLRAAASSRASPRHRRLLALRASSRLPGARSIWPGGAAFPRGAPDRHPAAACPRGDSRTARPRA